MTNMVVYLIGVTRGRGLSEGLYPVQRIAGPGGLASAG